MFEDISGMTREEILERIKDNGFFIANVKDPDEEMQLEAIEENYFCIRFKNKTHSKFKSHYIFTRCGSDSGIGATPLTKN